MNIDPSQFDEWKRKLKSVTKQLDDLLFTYGEHPMPIRMILDIQEISKKLVAVREEVFNVTKPEEEKKKLESCDD